MASAGRNSYLGGMNYDSHPGGMSFDSRPGGISYDSMRRKGGGLHGQGRGSHVAIFGEDPTVVMQVFHACERRMGVESREGKGGGNING